MVNSHWSDMFPTAKSHYMEFNGSDHRPLVSIFDSAKRKSNRIFRYDRRLKDNQEVKDLITTTWLAAENLHSEVRLAKVRKALVQWSKEKHLNSRETIERIKKELDEALSSRVGDEDLIYRLNNELIAAYKAEEDFWRQRSRIFWLASGDKNTQFFHAVATGKKARNRISVIEDAEGKIFHEEEQIAAQIAEYYDKLFKSSSLPSSKEETVAILTEAISPCITAEMNQSLTSVPSFQEIRDALFSIHPNKAPGPDGFSACFFQSNWVTIGEAICKEVQGFFTSGIMRETTNRTFVRLIPKGSWPKLVSDYMPIALCNVTYKLISKILSLRLRPILQSIIGENQSAFVKDRAISDNVLITHKLLYYLKNSEANINCSMAVKTDMSKAYDRLEWDFIRIVLERLGFDTIWTSWIMTCVSSVSYSYLLDDSTHGSVIPSRGIRQGDPLSPYLFILCGEVLSGLCRKAHSSGHMTGLRVSTKAPRINHLLFADDTMFFLNTDVGSCATLSNILRKYETVSGQMINTDKSSISFSSQTPQETRQRVHNYLGIEKEGEVGKYLGLPEHFGRRKRDLFTSNVERIRQRANSWSTRRLTSAGKLVMLKSILSAIPTYAMTCFLLPVSLCQRIQSDLTRFWSDSCEGKRKMCWIS